MKSFVIASILGSWAVLSAQAQTVVTNEPPKKNPWDVSATLGATLTRGNSKTLMISGQIAADKKWGQNELSLGVDGVYGENEVQVPGDGKTTQTSAESLHGVAQYNRLFSERLYGYFRLEGLYDGIADIDYRFTVSPGAGYYVIKTQKLFLRAEAGPGYVVEKLGGVADDYATLRLAERLEWKIGSKSKLWEMVEYLPQVDRFQNYVVNAEIGLDTPISTKLSQVTFLQNTYRSEPAEGRLHNDMKLVAAIKYKF